MRWYGLKPIKQMCMRLFAENNLQIPHLRPAHMCASGPAGKEKGMVFYEESDLPGKL